MVTGIKFKDGVEVTEVNQVAACFNWLNTSFDNNLLYLEQYEYRFSKDPAFLDDTSETDTARVVVRIEDPVVVEKIRFRCDQGEKHWR